MNLGRVSSQVVDQVFRMLLPIIIPLILVVAIWTYFSNWYNRSQGVTEGVVKSNVYVNKKAKHQQRLYNEETNKQNRSREVIERDFPEDHENLDKVYKK